MTLTEVNDLLSDALQSDLEHGVKWLNEEASAKFSREYPALSAALATLYETELREEAKHLRSMPSKVSTEP